MNNQRYSPIIGRNPDEIIAFSKGLEVDVAKFISQAISLADRLPQNRYVLNLFSDRFDFLLGFCAAVIAGQCTLMPPNRLDGTLNELTLAYPDSYTLSDAGKTGETNSVEPNDTDPDVCQHDGPFPMVPDDQLCAIAFTSGSTGKPSPNMKYWHTLKEGTLGNIDLLLKKSNVRLNVVATVPPQHMWGLETSILLPMFANVAISDRTPFYPQDIADALSSVPAPRALVSSPVHLNTLEKSGVSLSGVDNIFSATAPMSMDLAQKLENRFDARVLEVFGCTESGILAARHTSEETLWHLSELFELETGEAGTLVKAGHLSENVMIGDRIEKEGEHHFKWLGRHQDMINIAGKRGSLTDLNQRLLSVPGVEDGVIFSPPNNPERLAALVVAPKLKPSDITEALRPIVDSVFLPRPVYLVSMLPRQETGKLANAAVMSLFDEFSGLEKRKRPS